MHAYWIHIDMKQLRGFNIYII